MKQAKYQEIANSIANSIVSGEYKEGQKLHGRSSLAGRFNVSPETIRRAIAILQSEHIVSVQQGSGITIGNKWAAERFLRSYDQKKDLQEILTEWKELSEQRRAIDARMDMLAHKLTNFVVLCERTKGNDDVSGD